MARLSQVDEQFYVTVAYLLEIAANGSELFMAAEPNEKRELMTYTLITTEPNKEARAIHDRMPVILHPEDEASWIEPSRTKREDLESFLHPLELKN